MNIVFTRFSTAGEKFAMVVPHALRLSEFQLHEDLLPSLFRIALFVLCRKIAIDWLHRHVGVAFESTARLKTQD